MKRSDRKVLFALLLLLGVSLAIVVGNRMDRPLQITKHTQKKDLSVQVYCHDENKQPYEAFFCEDQLLVQSQLLLTEFRSETKVDKVRMVVTDNNGNKTSYLPRERITNRMRSSGDYKIYWSLKNLPSQGTMVVTIEMGSEKESFQTEYISGIPDLVSFFVEQSDVFNLEMRMENLQVGTPGETIVRDGLRYTELTGPDYSSLEDMDQAVKSLFSDKYIAEYHDFFDDYYFFFDHKMYQREATGIQEVSLIRTADIQAVSYKKVKTDKCTLRCDIQDGYYLLHFVQQDQDWRLNKFEYIKN